MWRGEGRGGIRGRRQRKEGSRMYRNYELSRRCSTKLSRSALISTIISLSGFSPPSAADGTQAAASASSLYRTELPASLQGTAPSVC